MIIRKDTTCIRDIPFGVLEMLRGASGFPTWSIGLSYVWRWPMPHRALPAPLYVRKSPSEDAHLLVL